MLRSILSRRKLGLLLLAAVATASLACGRNRVVLDVDARSFMEGADLVHPYDVLGLLPFSVRLDSVPVNLIEGFQDFGAAESATIDLVIDYDNVTGSGQGQFRLFFSDSVSTLFSTPVVAVIDADLAPGAVSTRTAHVVADQRLLDLFTNKQFFMGAELEWLSVTTERLQGTARIARIDLHLVSTLDVFR